MTLSITMNALSVLEAEGYAAPSEVQGILEARAAAIDPVPLRQLALARLEAAIRDGDAPEATAAAAAYDLCPQVPYYASAGPAVENATVTALEAVIDGSDAYSYLAARFTGTGKALADAMKKCDPDLPAEEAAVMTSAPKSAAWASVPGLCSTLDRLTEEMVLVARDLAGVHFHTVPFAHPDDLLPLTVRYPGEEAAAAILETWLRQNVPGGVNQQHAVLAHGGRAGLWGDIIAAGGTIEAPAIMADFKRWPEPPVKKAVKPTFVVGGRFAPGPKEAAYRAKLAEAAAQKEAEVADVEAAIVAAAAALETPETPVASKLGRPQTTADAAALRKAAGLPSKR